MEKELLTKIIEKIDNLEVKMDQKLDKQSKELTDMMDQKLKVQ